MLKDTWYLLRLQTVLKTFASNQPAQKANKSMPCVYYNDFSKHLETKGVFYRHTCSSSFAQDGKISAHDAQDCKIKHSKTINSSHGR